MATEDALLELCESIRSQWPSHVGSEEAWYIALVSSLITCHKLEECTPVILHIARSLYTEDEQRKRFFIRLTDVLMKLSQLVGIPLVVVALSQVVKAEDELGIAVPSREEQEQTSRYLNLEATKDLDERGEAHMRLLYRSNLDQIMGSWKAHQVDNEWLQKRIIYGLFLSDHGVLNIVETEVLILSSIMCQGLESPTMWHIRGLRRLGIEVDDAELVCDLIKKVAKFSGKDTSSWLMAKNVDIGE